MTFAKAGFTLIELTLVAVIILVLASLSVPMFRNTFQDLSAKDTTFNISKFISYAQERAIIERNNYKIIFDFNNRRYQLFASAQSEGKTVYKKAGGRFGKIFTLPQGLSFYDPKPGTPGQPGEAYKKETVFYPDGHSDQLLLDVIGKNGAGYSIASKGFGGVVGVKEVTRER